MFDGPRIDGSQLRSIRGESEGMPNRIDDPRETSRSSTFGCGRSTAQALGALDDRFEICVRSYFVGGSVPAIDVAAAEHAGWPHPAALIPGICPACDVMSYTMLSFRVGSPLTPAGTKSRFRVLRVRHA